MKTFKQFLTEDINNINVEDEIIKLFKDNEIVDDLMIHSLSDKLGIDTHIFEGYIYKLLSDFFYAGKALNYSGEYDPKQLEMGIKVEMEHTTNPKIAERIAKDHLVEISDYYTRLAKMEKEAGIKESLKEATGVNNKIQIMKQLGITPEKDFLLWNRVNAFIPVKYFNKIKGNEENIKNFNYRDKKKTIEKDWLLKYVLNK